MDSFKMTNWNPHQEEAPNYRAYSASDLTKLPQLERLDQDARFAMQVVSHVLPFKSNNYVVENLIDWDDPRDPIYQLTFPQRGMLNDRHFARMADAVRSVDVQRIKLTSNEIRHELNPHPAGQKTFNTPRLEDGTRLEGMQHKYRQTVLFFASQGQTCHAYCTFCFRWPQFVALDGLKFAMKEADQLVQYLREHEEVTDVLFTGGDPMVMRTKFFRAYVEAILKADDLPHIRTIRIGTKAISYWPYRFINEADSRELMDLFRAVVRSGRQLAVMAHVNHPAELNTSAARLAVKRIRETGAMIRTQSPLMRHINDTPGIWASMWQRQLTLGMVPYYMFLARDTGAQDYFAMPLARAYEIYSSAIRMVGGLGRTVRGPSMSCTPGKVAVDGISRIHGEKVFILRMLQGRNPDWAYKPFFAKYDPSAIWLDDLEPAFGEDRFFFERDTEWPASECDGNLDSDLDEVSG